MSPTPAVLGNLAMLEPCEVPSVDRDTAIESVIESFLGSAVTKKTTARGYRRHLLHAFGIMAVEKLSDLQPVLLMNFRRYLLADGRGAATHAQAIIALRSFLTWAAALRGHDIPMDQASYLLKVPKVEVIKPHETLSDKEIPKFLECAKRLGKRDYALMMVALGSGVRVAELVALDIRDIRHDGADGTVIHVRQGKGGKDRMVPVRPEVRKAVEDYLAESMRKRGDAGPCFFLKTEPWGRVTPGASQRNRHPASSRHVPRWLGLRSGSAPTRCATPSRLAATSTAGTSWLFPSCLGTARLTQRKDTWRTWINSIYVRRYPPIWLGVKALASVRTTTRTESVQKGEPCVELTEVTGGKRSRARGRKPGGHGARTT